MRRSLIACAGMIWLFTACQGQPLSDPASKPAAGEINWISFEEAVKLAEKEPKKIFIDVYTSWCGWCKKMDATTFKDAQVVALINSNFYPVKLNAETRDTIVFRDQQFKYIPEYKANELAISLLNGKMGYPSYVMLDENFSMMSQPVQSFMQPEQLMPILKYFAENIYKSKTWEEYSGTR